MLEKELYDISKHCLQGRPVPIDHIEVEKDSLYHIPGYMEEKQYRRLVMIVDKNTKKAAGLQLLDLCQTVGMQVNVIHLQENEHGQVTADEETIMQVFVQVPDDTQCAIAVGSGTVHDITRFVSAKMKIPFISVPTAPSVDGFTSKGAPLILGEVKKTIQASCPVAVFADTRVLQKAPAPMRAAGIGDMLAKYTSVFDWDLSYMIGGETYNKWARHMMKEALFSCKNNFPNVADGTEEGITTLMKSLILSGVLMMALDHSRPASGAEHHLSHYWELSLLEQGEKQLLHGAKVGVATVIISDLYKYYFQKPEQLPIKNCPEYKKRLEENKEDIKRLIYLIPSSDEMKSWLEMFQGPTTPEELGLSDELVKESLNNAHYLRDRCTGLKLIHMSRKQVLTYPFNWGTGVQ